ncbi:gamma-secretase subunit Aph-1b-like isoform 16-T18 [Morphnus guianensis]
MSHLPHPCSAGLACTHVHLWKSFYVALCGFHVCGLSSGLGWSCGCSPQQVWFSDGEVTRMVGWCRVRPWLPPTLSWCCTVPQEAARLCQPPACSPLCRKAIEGLVALSEDGCSPISIQQMAYDALGPGTTGIHGDSQLYFLTSAFMTMVLIFLHTFWGILFFHGCEHQRWWEITAVVIMHLAVSGSTFCNPLYMGSLVPSYLLMATAATWAYLLSGGSAQNLRRFLLCLWSGASPQLES